MTGHNRSINLDIVETTEGKHYSVAKCLQLDVVTSGYFKESMRQSIVSVCLTQIIYSINKNLIDHLFRTESNDINQRLAEELISQKNKGSIYIDFLFVDNIWSYELNIQDEGISWKKL